MKVLTYEGIIENGSIHIPGEPQLPENAKVYVIFPQIYEIETPKVAHIYSPRLVNPEQAGDLTMEVFDLKEYSSNEVPLRSKT